MRIISEVCFDYLQLLKKEGKIELTEKEIEYSSNDTEDQKRIKESIHNELGCGPSPLDTSYEIYQGQKISSLRAFRIYCDIIVNEDVSTGVKVWNKFVRESFLLIERHKKSLNNARRFIGKTFFAALYTSFKMYIIQYFQVLGGFNIPLMIHSFFDLYREIIDNNELLSDKKDKNQKNLVWAKSKCKYNGGRIEGVTLGSTGRSKHVNFVFIDDIYGREGGDKYTNEDVRKFINGDLMPIWKRKKGRIAIFGTVDNTDDIYHTFTKIRGEYRRKLLMCTRDTIAISDEGWACRLFPAVLDFDKKIVYLPEFFSWEDILEDRRDMKDFQWYKEMQQEIKLDKSSTISEYLFNNLRNKEYIMYETGKKETKYLMIVDPSAGEGEDSDYAAIAIFEIKGKKKILRYIWHERMLPIIDPNGQGFDLSTKVERTFYLFLKPDLYIENNSVGRPLIQELRSRKIEPFEHNTKEDKVKIMMEAISELKNEGSVIIPFNQDDSFTIESVAELKKECIKYALRELRGKLTIEGRGSPDDLVTVFLLGVHYAKEETDTVAEAICTD